MGSTDPQSAELESFELPRLQSSHEEARDIEALKHAVEEGRRNFLSSSSSGDHEVSSGEILEDEIQNLERAAADMKDGDETPGGAMNGMETDTDDYIRKLSEYSESLHREMPQ